MSIHGETLVLAASRWDRAAAFVLVLSAIGLALLSGFNPGALLFLCIPLVVVARALWIRRLEANSEGLRLNDGVFRHHVEWTDVDGIVLGRRSRIERPAVRLLHHGRFIDLLPLPGDGLGRRHWSEVESMVATLIGLREAHAGEARHDWCPVRIDGGLRGRLGMTVAVVDPSGRFQWLIAPDPRLDLLVFLLRGRSRRRRAETVRAEAATARGCPPTDA